MSEELVTVRRVSLPIDAHLIQAQLEAAGITAFVLDAESASINPLLVDAMGGVRVQVRGADVARALEVLRETHHDPDEELADLSPEGRCPRCRSEYTRLEWTPLQKAASAVLLFAPLLVLDKSMYCQQCEHRWEAEPESQRRRHTPYRAPARKAPGERPVFRLRRTQAMTGMLAGAILSTGIAIGLGDGRWVVLTAAGWMFGRARASDVCSEPTCRAPLPDGADECPRCRGSVKWVIAGAAEHFAARAEWRRKERESAPGGPSSPG